jgi:hypothetical protein
LDRIGSRTYTPNWPSLAGYDALNVPRLEVEEVGPPGGLLEGNPVADQDQTAGIDRVAEEVEVGVVRDWVVGDGGSLAMAGCARGGRERQEREERQQPEPPRAPKTGIVHE